MTTTIVVNNFDNSYNDTWGWFVDIDNQSNKKNKKPKIIIKFHKDFDEINDEYDYYIKHKRIHNLETIEEDIQDENKYENKDENKDENKNTLCFQLYIIKISYFSCVFGLLTYIILSCL